MQEGCRTSYNTSQGSANANGLRKKYMRQKYLMSCLQSNVRYNHFCLSYGG